MKNRGERRKNDFIHALRKRNIDHQVAAYPAYDNLHQYSKNKIHCSCPMCRDRWKGNSFDENKLSDKKRLQEMEEQMGGM